MYKHVCEIEREREREATCRYVHVRERVFVHMQVFAKEKDSLPVSVGVYIDIHTQLCVCVHRRRMYTRMCMNVRIYFKTCLGAVSRISVEVTANILVLQFRIPLTV